MPTNASFHIDFLWFQHFNDFWILMVGRLLGGIATSILYSAFESWLIYEHNKVLHAELFWSCNERLVYNLNWSQKSIAKISILLLSTSNVYCNYGSWFTVDINNSPHVESRYFKSWTLSLPKQFFLRSGQLTIYVENYFENKQIKEYPGQYPLLSVKVENDH